MEAPLHLGWEEVRGTCHRLNENGEMIGLEWIREAGVLTTPVAITNTHSVGVVRDTLVTAELEARTDEDEYWCMPVVAETFDGTLRHRFRPAEKGRRP